MQGLECKLVRSRQACIRYFEFWDFQYKLGLVWGLYVTFVVHEARMEATWGLWRVDGFVGTGFVVKMDPRPWSGPY